MTHRCLRLARHCPCGVPRSPPRRGHSGRYCMVVTILYYRSVAEVTASLPIRRLQPWVSHICKEAGLGAGVAHGGFTGCRLDLGQQGIAVTVHGQAVNPQDVAGFFSLQPELAPAAAPEVKG